MNLPISSAESKQKLGSDLESRINLTKEGWYVIIKLLWQDHRKYNMKTQSIMLYQEELLKEMNEHKEFKKKVENVVNSALSSRAYSHQHNVYYRA